MQVRQLLATALVSISALGAANAMAGDGSSTNAVGTTTYSATSERTRDAVVAEMRAPAASADGGVTNAVGTTSYPVQGERSRASVVAELRNSQALGAWHPVGEVGDAPVVRQILEDTALAQGQTRINVALGRVHAKKAQAQN